MYNYETEKAQLFTDEGQRKLIKTRDNVLRIVKEAGCIRMQEALRFANMGDSWSNMAMIDRLVELGDLVEISKGDEPGQYRIFRAPYQ
jgi:hypothetical protein